MLITLGIILTFAIGLMVGYLSARLRGTNNLRRLEDRLASAQAEVASASARCAELQRQQETTRQELGHLRERLSQEQIIRAQAETRVEETEKRLQEQIELLDEAKAKLADTFDALAASALSRANEELLKMAKERLGSERDVTLKGVEARKSLIDQSLSLMTQELGKVAQVIKELEKDREAKFGELASQLKDANQQTAHLMQTAHSLKEVLSSTQARGQWGERMAEDILRVAGFIENVNYIKQKAIEGGQAKPDFTFLLPKKLTINMDVKFPLNNYMRYIATEAESDRERFKAEFLRDVKCRIKEVTSRDYIDPGQNTIDYVLLFIPNEQIYAFIHEQDRSLLDEALQQKVVFCSPITLFAVLAVIRQATDSFALERTSNQILSLMGAFRKQWDLFLEKLASLGRRIESSQKEFEELVSTRRRMLEQPLNKIEELRQQKQLPVASPAAEEEALPALGPSSPQGL